MPLSRADPRFDFAKQLFTGWCHLQYFGTTVAFSCGPLYQSFRDQAADHVPNSGPVESDDVYKGRLVNTGMQADSQQGRILYRRDIEILRLGHE